MSNVSIGYLFRLSEVLPPTCTPFLNKMVRRTDKHNDFQLYLVALNSHSAQQWNPITPKFCTHVAALPLARRAKAVCSCASGAENSSDVLFCRPGSELLNTWNQSKWCFLSNGSRSVIVQDDNGLLTTSNSPLSEGLVSTARTHFHQHFAQNGRIISTETTHHLRALCGTAGNTTSAFVWLPDSHTADTFLSRNQLGEKSHRTMTGSCLLAVGARQKELQVPRTPHKIETQEKKIKVSTQLGTKQCSEQVPKSVAGVFMFSSTSPKTWETYPSTLGIQTSKRLHEKFRRCFYLFTRQFSLQFNQFSIF